MLRCISLNKNLTLDLDYLCCRADTVIDLLAQSKLLPNSKPSAFTWGLLLVLLPSQKAFHV